MRQLSMRQLALSLGVAIASASPAVPAAHDPGLSGLQVTIAEQALGATLTFAGADFAAALGRAADRDGNGEIDAAELAAMPIAEVAPTWLVMVADTAELPLRVVGAHREPDGDIAVRFTATLGPSAQELRVRVPSLGELPFGHRQFATVARGDAILAESLLHARAAELRCRLGAATDSVSRRSETGSCTSLGAFLHLGIEHVVTGYDHLLFLLGMLLAVASFGHALAIVTAFTVAHSLTLGLATLDLARAPVTLVECAIALSVVLVGADNLLRPQPRARAGWTFAFGLIHGFGFAACLADLDIGRGRAAVLPLLGFNLGVEVGQLALVAIALPGLLLWQRRQPATFARARVAMSALLLLAGGGWLLERLP